MWNASEFMKTLKQHYTMSFNGRRDHHGTMWESRYHVRVKDPGDVGTMMAESGYVDANPVNAGIVDWPDKYEWCSFAADLELVRANKRPERCGKCYAAGLETPGYVPQVIEKGDNVLAIRLLQLLQWHPRPPAYLRTTLGITSREYFTKAYLRPLTEAGLIARTDPDHPNSPRQNCVLTMEGEMRIRKVAPL